MARTGRGPPRGLPLPVFPTPPLLVGLGSRLLCFRTRQGQGERWPGRCPALLTHRLAPLVPGTIVRAVQAAAPSAGPIGRPEAEGPAPASQQSQGRCPCPSREVGRWGRMLPPPAASAWGALSTPLGSISLHLAGPQAAPARGSWAAATRCQTPWGTEPYTSMSAPPTLDLHPALHFRKRALYAPPASSLSPARSSLGCRVEETGDLHPLGTEAPLPAAPRGWLQSVPLTPWVILLLKLPSKMVWGPGPSLSSLPSFYLCFCLQIGVGSSTGPGQRSPSPGCQQERVLARARLQSWPRPSLTPPRTTL